MGWFAQQAWANSRPTTSPNSAQLPSELAANVTITPRSTVPFINPTVPTAAESFGNNSLTQALVNAANTGSGRGGTEPVQLDISRAPPPSQERQPELRGRTRQDPRFVDDGTARTQIFDINSFRSEILENGVLPSHTYLVTFAPFRTGFPENAPLTNFVTNKRNTLVMRCESIVLPTSSLLEEENIRRYGYGPVEKFPYGVQFSDVIMTWVVDKNSEIIDFFHQWMNTIIMHDSPSTLMMGGQNRTGLSTYDPFEVGYKDAYTNPIVRIYVYNRQNQTVTTYEMYDVFPMNIQAMNLSWADENQVQKLSVTFAYTNMRVEAPLKVSNAQVNFLEAGQLPPNEERIQPADRGGAAARDAAEAPGSETNRRTAGASRPNATESASPPDTPPTTTVSPLVRNIPIA